MSLGLPIEKVIKQQIDTVVIVIETGVPDIFAQQSGHFLGSFRENLRVKIIPGIKESRRYRCDELVAGLLKTEDSLVKEGNKGTTYGSVNAGLGHLAEQRQQGLMLRGRRVVVEIPSG